MAANTTPIFVLSSALSYCQVTTANTNRDGATGAYVSLITGGTNGTIIDMVRVVATGTTTAGVVRLFVSTDSGSTKRLLAEILVPAITPGTTVTVFTYDWIPTRPLVLTDATDSVWGSTHVSETFNLFAFGGNY